MERIYKFWEQNHPKIKSTFKIVIFLLLIIAGFFYLYIQSSNLNTEIYKTDPTIPIIQEDLNPDSIKPKSSVPKIIASEIKMLFPTKENGRVWYAKWSNEIARTIKSGASDPLDSEFVARGNGTIFINGEGIANLRGDSPRMYVLDPAKNKKWNNVEVTIYAKRISESGVISSQGIVIGARSEHQDATIENPCLGATYYGRLLYDGRAVFQKEVIHEGAYSINKPSENNKAKWDTPLGTMPQNVWIGVKFIVKTNPDGKSVKLELYRDLTDGYNGGTWEKVAEYTDNGDWAQTDSSADVMAKCGYSASKILLDPGTSVFVRNDKVEDVEYKLFSIREID
jgi:hypothetical protein